MADQLQLRRGTTSQVLAFTGAQGEVIMDTSKNALVLQDGLTAGGFYAATGKQLTENTFYYNEDVGSTANSYILVPKSNTITPASYTDGTQFGFVSIHANTGPSTANFQGLGVRSLKYAGGTDPLAGEIFGRISLVYDATNNWMEIQRRASGPPPQLRSITGAVGSNTLVATLAPCVIDFRSASLGNGAVSQASVTSQLSLTVPAGATLGTANATQSRIMVLAILAAGNVELAVVNLSGGINLDETTLINTTAITSGASSANVIYSNSTRSGVPFRVMGYIESTQATAGSWVTVPSTVQGAGGQAIAAMSSLGYGQKWQNVTGSRSLGTNYTNTTGKPIAIHVQGVSTATAQCTITVDGVGFTSTAQVTAGNVIANAIIVPPGSVYQAAIGPGTPTLTIWGELR